MSYPTYENYKYSGVEWLGSVPSGWEVKRLRFVIDTNPPLSTFKPRDDELVSFIPMNAVGENGGLILKENKFPFEVGSGYTPFLNNDVIVAKITPCFENGKGALAENLTNGLAFGTTELHVLRSHNETHSKYLFYLTMSHAFREIGEGSMYGAGGQKRISDLFINDFRLGIPTYSEQKAIAAFLDRKIKAIDDLIAKKEKLLELLAEKRTALITQAVTKGLDPTAPMKPSGVVWFDEMPKSWQLRNLKGIGRLKGGAGFPHDYQNITDEELYFYKVGDLSKSADNIHITQSDHTVSRATANALGAEVIPANTVVYAKIGAALLLNRRRITTKECCIDNNMTALIPDETKVSTKYLYYWMTCLDFGEHTNPGAVPSLSEGYQSILPIPLPHRDEQNQIVKFLDIEIPKYESTINKVNNIISKLKEYRTALITNAVTGKIKVV